MSRLDRRLPGVAVPPDERIEEVNDGPEEKVYYKPEKIEVASPYQVKSPIKLRREVEEKPIKEGYEQINIAGIPIDAHDLEAYQLSAASPKQIANLMDLVKTATIREYRSMAAPGKGMKGSTWLIIIVMIMMACAGLFMIIFLPEIMAMFQGGM